MCAKTGGPRMPESLDPDTRLETVVVPRTHELAEGFEVRRALPSRQRRMVGPFIFLDQMGPHVFTTGAGLDVRPEYPEQAIYVAQGTLDLGSDGRFEAGQLLVLRPGRGVTLSAAGPHAARIMLLGGEPMDSPRYISWNFVSSSAERIEQAKDDWRHQRFGKVPGETEFIPLPDLPGRPVRYP